MAFPSPLMLPSDVIVVQMCTVRWGKEQRGAGGAALRQRGWRAVPAELPDGLLSLIVPDRVPPANSHHSGRVLVHRMIASPENNFIFEHDFRIEAFSGVTYRSVKPLELTLGTRGTLEVAVVNDWLTLGAPRRKFVRKHLGTLSVEQSAVVEFNGRFTSSAFMGGAWSYSHTRLLVARTTSLHRDLFTAMLPQIVHRDLHDLW